MDKPIKDWTLSEAQEYCSTYRSNLSEGFCEESDCELSKRGICHKDWVHDWSLDTFTQEEVDDAIMILHLFPSATFIERYINILTVRYDNEYLATIDYNLFPSIKPGEKIQLGDIINS